MGYRTIDRSADYSSLNEGWFGIDSYIDVGSLEFLHLFGTAYPDNRLRERWDYSLNDRSVASNAGMTVGAQASSGGTYTLRATSADLGPAFTAFAVVKRNPSVTGPSAYLSNYAGGLGYSTALVNAGTAYNANVHGNADQTVITAAAATDAYTGTGYEMIAMVCPGDGNLKLYVQRPSGFTSLVGTATGLTPGKTYSGARLLVGDIYPGGAAKGDSIAAVGGLSTALSAAGVAALQVSMRRLFADYGGPLI